MQGTDFERAEIAGPGFLNFFLKQQWFSRTVETVLQEGDDYGRTETGAGKRILVEFVSANPTGPMHVGNARGGALGDSLAEILNWAGNDANGSSTSTMPATKLKSLPLPWKCGICNCLIRL